MQDSKLFFALCCALPFTARTPARAQAEEPAIHVRPSQTAEALQQAIDTCQAAGGGRIILEGGTHLLDRPLHLRDAVHIAMIGQDDTRLTLAPQRVLVTADACKKGQTFVPVKGTTRALPSGKLEVQAPGRTDPTPGTDLRRQIPYFDITVKETANDRLILEKPLSHSVPKGWKVVSAYNAIEIAGTSRDIRLENLSIEGNRKAWPVAPRNHSRHCGIFLAGQYSYQTGPSPEPIRGVTIAGCTVRDFHHRGMALYSVANSLIDRCTVEQTGAEAIDLDHFVQRCRVTDCRIRQGAVGVELNDASHCTVDDTVIEDCPVGIKVWKWCQVDGWNMDNCFAGNTVHRASDTGIFLAKNTTKSRIVGNTLLECGIGVRLQGNASVIRDNHFHDCRIDIDRPKGDAE
ncbi:MAG: right-handed parallel beta-helix repeat-containing protein [Pirellulales bacterium]